MVLQSVQLLLVAVTSLEKRLIAPSNGLELPRKGLQFIVVVNVVALAARAFFVEIVGALTFRLFLPNELSLSLEKELVALVSVLTVLLKGLGFSLVSGKFGPGDFKFSGGIVMLVRFVMQSVIEPAPLLLQIVELGRL